MVNPLLSFALKFLLLGKDVQDSPCTHFYFYICLFIYNVIYILYTQLAVNSSESYGQRCKSEFRQAAGSLRIREDSLNKTDKKGGGIEKKTHKQQVAIRFTGKKILEWFCVCNG